MAKKTIVITGASDGIGKAAALQLVTGGHAVVLVGRSREKTEAVAKELSAPFYVADFARSSTRFGIWPQTRFEASECRCPRQQCGRDLR